MIKSKYYSYVALVGDKEIYFRTMDEGAEKLNTTKWLVCGAIYGRSNTLQRRGIMVYRIEEYEGLEPVRKQRIHCSPNASVNDKRCRRVHMLDPYTCEILDTFDSIADASRDLRVKYSSSVSKCCRGEIPTAHGYKWEYVD